MARLRRNTPTHKESGTGDRAGILRKGNEVKKTLLTAVVLLVSMLGVAPAQAAADDVTPVACGTITHGWSGIEDWDWFVPDGYVNLRMAWYVTYCNGSPTSIQTYLAVTCESPTGTRHACSFDWRVDAWDNDNHYEDRGNTNPNTGNDGFASTYGPARAVTRCHTYEVEGSVSNLGLDGRRYPGLNRVGSAGDFNPCA
jgi:hypothetical protein